MHVNLQKNVLDDIEKVVTDGTGPKEVMGGSEHSQNEFVHKNNTSNRRSESLSLNID